MTTPATNREFWTAKFKANVERDERTEQELESLGWKVAIVWECAIRDRGQFEIASVLQHWLEAHHFQLGKRVELIPCAVVVQRRAPARAKQPF